MSAHQQSLSPGCSAQSRTGTTIPAHVAPCEPAGRRLPPFDRERLDATLSADGIDVLLASSRHACRYLLGGYAFHMFPDGAEAIALTRYLPLVGYRPGRVDDAFYIGSAVEREGLARDRPWPGDISCNSWTLEDSVAAAVSRLESQSLHGARIGVEIAQLPAAALLALQRALPAAQIVDATRVVEALRMVKQPYELAHLRSAAHRIEAAMIAATATATEGQTTAEIALTVADGAAARGLAFDHCFVSTGANQERTPSSRRWHPPAALSIDFGGRLGGYVGDIARMFCMGGPTAQQSDALRAVASIQAAARHAIGPDVPGNAVTRAAVAAIDALAEPQRISFLAHGLGLLNHEAPWLADDAPWKYPARHAMSGLEPGTVLSIETTLLDPDVGFIKLEDMVVVTDTGSERLGTTQHEWMPIGERRGGASDAEKPHLGSDEDELIR